MQLVFWLIIFLIFAHYIGWGLLVITLGLFKKKEIIEATELPSVSCIIAAYNEEKIILQKIENQLNLDYPKNKIETIIVTDGSTDLSPDIVKSYKHKNMILIHNNLRLGKSSAINNGISKSKGEIIIFSDANSIFKKDAIKKLIRHFADPNIGGVAGKKSVKYNKNRHASLGDQLFWMYESALKNAESKLGSIPTGDGEIFAIRKNLYKPIDIEVINDDMQITFNIISNGKRVIYDSEAVAEEEASITLKEDFKVKARMVYGSLQMMYEYRQMLNPFTSLFAFQFFIHKTLRYFMWLQLLLLLAINLLIWDFSKFYQTTLYLQLLFYFSAITGHILSKNRLSFKPFYLSLYYCNVNIAAIKGAYYFLTQKSKIEIWTKAER